MEEIEFNNPDEILKKIEEKEKKDNEIGREHKKFAKTRQGVKNEK